MHAVAQVVSATNINISVAEWPNAGSPNVFARNELLVYVVGITVDQSGCDGMPVVFFELLDERVRKHDYYVS